MVWPFGDQRGEPPWLSVRGACPEPSALQIQGLTGSLRHVRNVMREPSGEQCRLTSADVDETTLDGFEPLRRSSKSILQMLASTTVSV